MSHDKLAAASKPQTRRQQTVRRRATERLAEIDTDHDGVLSIDELVRLVTLQEQVNWCCVVGFARILDAIDVLKVLIRTLLDDADIVCGGHDRNGHTGEEHFNSCCCF